jgi:hypothetical protein
VNQLYKKQLIELAKKSKLDSGGFGWLAQSGDLIPRDKLEAWVNFRMTYVFALEAIHGNREVDDYLRHGLLAMKQLFLDEANGGYYSLAPRSGEKEREKRAYEFAFALLALSAGKRANSSEESSDLNLAISIFEEYFWDEVYGLVNESWDEDFTICNKYHGLNSNMHSVEAFLELFKSTSDPKWLNRAVRVCRFAFDSSMETKIGLIPEHFDENWKIDHKYNQDHPDDPFRPFGIIIGHQFEWCRLAIELSAALGQGAPTWLAWEAARIYEIAKRIGWHADQSDGFVYTVDFDGKAIVNMRMHWVITEAIAAAWTLSKLTGSREYFNDFQIWWEYAQKFFLDHTNGSWKHELDHNNKESSTVWIGRPDIYHAHQMYLKVEV